ncbi:aldo/keto reductase [Streptomyces brasiliensis]|uniref:Oxidoreductase n=1 Tax=Streptomyces brasiliensis TaxID=1954 RepID=A0A917L1S0_9ACTN|nr:aldo/keto reductase [Streptomyces brasiliensis]GGJ40414.1 oxidoreductase [Streptomyces brasiliensis]
MTRRRLGRTTVEVTDLGFGAASLGNLYRATTDAEAEAALDAALDAGLTYFDTAPHYGLGLSERRIGRCLRGVPRDRFVVSTKVGRLLDPNPRPTGSDLASGGFDVPDDFVRRFDFTADGVRRSLDESLQRLGLDRVDMVFVHDPDDQAQEAVTQAVPALVELREQGVIGAIGVGMNQWQVPMRMVRETDIDVVMLAGRWTLLDRSGQALLDACLDRGVSVVAAAPYNSGLLAKNRPDANAYFNYQQAPGKLLERVGAMADVCERFGVRLPDAATQFPLRHPAVASVVAGLRSPAQVEQFVARRRATVPEAAWTALEALSRPAAADG